MVVYRLSAIKSSEEYEKCHLQRMYDIFNKLQGAQLLSKIDLHLGYHKVEIKSDDISKIAFRTCYNHFEFLV